MESNFLGKDSFVWWKGVVEDRKDPIMLGRVKVRIFGWHSEDPQQIPTEDLPWASVSTPADTGRNPVGLKEGDWVWGFFMDGADAQRPIVVGLIPGIDEKPKAPELGFGDPTKPEDITPDSQPRPLDVNAQSVQDSTSTSEQSQPAGGKFFNTDKVPGMNMAFGELTKYYDPLNCKFDVNGDGVFDTKDALVITKASLLLYGQKFFNGLGQLSSLGGDWINKFFNLDGSAKSVPDEVPPTPTTSPYPLADRLMEPTTSRLARNENVEQTIVGLKKGSASTITTAAFEDSAVGMSSPVAPQSFDEPETPYDAKYPFNHVYESESGHFVEIDDSPGAERLHWYHRSGTFREIHPDGTQVTKVKKADYNFVVEDYFCAAEKTLNLSAVEAIKAKSDQAIVFQSGSSFNRQVGENDNLSVNGDSNTRIKGSAYSVIEEDLFTHISDGAYVCITDGALHIKAKDKIIIDADGPIQFRSKESIKLNAPSITLQGTTGGLTDINLVSATIRSVFLMAHTAITAGLLGVPAIPGIAVPAGADDNFAEDDGWYDDTTEDASKKYGFVLPKADLGTVWKPISDSDKKLVTLSPAGSGPHKLYEAIPTGQLEPVKIAYEHPDGQRTEWEVVRPVHEKGKEITNLFGPPTADVFLDGRTMFRWGAPGKDFPKQLFLDTGNGVLNFILDSAIRHQSSVTGFGANDEQSSFDVTKPGPEAGKEEESGTAAPKYGYLFPKGTTGDVYKPASESDGNLVTLSEAGETHELYEAIETDAKEIVRIKYLTIQQNTTEWTVTRPVFKRGNLIESPKIKTMFIDKKRHMCRFSKPGSQYPKNMFLVIKKNGVVVTEHFIIEAGGRHQYTLGYDQNIARPAEDVVVDNSTSPVNGTTSRVEQKNSKKQQTRSRRKNSQVKSQTWNREQRRNRTGHA